MIERYKIVKILYPDYLIYIKDKETLKLIDIDKKIVENFNVDDTNKIILNNLDIEEIEEYKDNNYKELLIKTKIIELIKSIGDELI